MKKILLFSLLFVSTISFSQVGIGTTAPNSSAALDVTSRTKGLLPPRLTEGEMNTIATPANGLIVFCTDCTPTGIYTYNSPSWSALGGATAATVSATCTGFVGNYCSATLSGTTYVVTMKNNDFSAKQVTPSTADLTLSGLTGVTVASVSPIPVQTIIAGASLVITYTISGTPAAAGTLTGTWAKQGLTCSSTVAVATAKAVTAASSLPALCISTPLTAITHTTSGTTTGIGTATGLPAGVTAAWASNTITISGTPTASGTFNYTIPVNGCGGAVNATGTITVNPLVAGAASATPTVPINVLMTNVTHSTTAATGIGAATGLPPGVIATWAANTITISGTPTALGTFAYSIPLVGTCGTANATGTITVVKCGAFVALNVYREFACFNLGATNILGSPNVPVQDIHGNYYQWGRSNFVATASTPPGAISSWNTTSAADGAWLDGSKTPNDPCPAGFRVPTKTQWDGVLTNNIVSRTGSWANDGNFTTAISWGPNVSTKTLTLPAAGCRLYDDGMLTSRGSNGYYWGSTENGDFAWGFYFNSSSAGTPAYGSSRANGFSVRCVSAE